MSTYDLHVTVIPDHKAELVIARLMVGADSVTTMQTALEKVTKPPVLLLQGLTKRDAEKHASHLKSLGVGVMIAEIEDASERHDGKVVPPTAARRPDPASDFGDIAGIRAHNAANRQEDPQTPVPPPYRPSVSSPLSTHIPHVFADDAERDHKHGRVSDYHTQSHRSGGVIIGALENSKRMEEAEEKERKKNLMITGVMTLLLLIVCAAVFLIPKCGDNAASQTAARDASAGSRSAREAAMRTGASLAPTADSTAFQSRERQRGAVGGQERQEANAYIDSARASGGNLDRRIAFYKMAISFNRYNHAAWHGLLQTYLDLQMGDEARETEEAMEEIFGPQAISVSNIVNRHYGELSDAYAGDDGVYRVEYRSRKHGRDDILRDIFNMIRATRNACACHNISVFATTGAGKGMIVHTTRETSVHNFSEFSRVANIVWLD